MNEPEVIKKTTDPKKKKKRKEKKLRTKKGKGKKKSIHDANKRAGYLHWNGKTTSRWKILLYTRTVTGRAQLGTTASVQPAWLAASISPTTYRHQRCYLGRVPASSYEPGPHLRTVLCKLDSMAYKVLADEFACQTRTQNENTRQALTPTCGRRLEEDTMLPNAQ
ncbi:hypothetical protein BO99DRAFT_100289 [Aspergillus violaceofuscus CBS 115571]|uniref:Uncharacterized protein n=1 Tax=Aspergillus violaceofuscus (strain CBS 115571) TaxID=1450538 RepID=A0A2V5HBG7_ASPV1|nr:hypothetical protein BO99DRAFT_100289 [Aspergillus violaceofuscus CBS 115571]